jgi:hypothetical protein
MVEQQRQARVVVRIGGRAVDGAWVVGIGAGLQQQSGQGEAVLVRGLVDRSR